MKWVKYPSATAFLASLAIATPAAAESTSWLSVAAGPAVLEKGTGFSEQAPVIEAATGIGTTPFGALVFGGVVRSQSFVGQGTDASVALRMTTGGYSLGTWGVAVDGGGFMRFWGGGSQGGMLAVTGGGPFGLITSVGAHLGSRGARGYSVSLGVDLARLTIFRTSGTNWFPNPFPPHELPARE